MIFTNRLIKGKLIKRYKRFFTDIKVNKEIITAHCPNTGSMLGLLNEDNEVWVSKNDDPKRKLKYTLEIIKVKNILVGVNTHLANKIVLEGLQKNSFNEFLYNVLSSELITSTSLLINSEMISLPISLQSQPSSQIELSFR